MSNEERIGELLEPWIGHRDCDDACNDKWDGDQLIAELTKLIDEDRQQLIQRIKEEVIGEDEEQVLPHPKLDNYDAVQRCVGRNQVRQTQREILETIKEETR